MPVRRLLGVASQYDAHVRVAVEVRVRHYGLHAAQARRLRSYSVTFISFKLEVVSFLAVTLTLSARK